MSSPFKASSELALGGSSLTTDRRCASTSHGPTTQSKQDSVTRSEAMLWWHRPCRCSVSQGTLHTASSARAQASRTSLTPLTETARLSSISSLTSSAPWTPSAERRRCAAGSKRNGSARAADRSAPWLKKESSKRSTEFPPMPAATCRRTIALQARSSSVTVTRPLRCSSTAEAAAATGPSAEKLTD